MDVLCNSQFELVRGLNISTVMQYSYSRLAIPQPTVTDDLQGSQQPMCGVALHAHAVLAHCRPTQPSCKHVAQLTVSSHPGCTTTDTAWYLA